MIGLLPRIVAAFGLIVVLGTALAFVWPAPVTPPCPGAKVAAAAPLTLASTARAEVLSPDAVYALEWRCIGDGGEPYTKPTYVACSCRPGVRGCRDWFYGVSDVPDRLRWAKR